MSQSNPWLQSLPLLVLARLIDYLVILIGSILLIKNAGVIWGDAGWWGALGLCLMYWAK
jgi:hypothetical protein